MAQPPRFKSFSRENFPDAPEWFAQFLLPLNEVTSGLVNAISKRLTRKENFLAAEKVGLVFTTRETAADTFPLRLKSELPSRPTHLWVTRLDVVEGEPISTPFSLTWRMAASGEIEVTFQGLAASTKYRATLAYE